MVKAGLAWHYKQYSSDPVLAQAEIDARNAKAGLWADPHAIAPWEFRHPPPGMKLLALCRPLPRQFTQQGLSCPWVSALRVPELPDVVRLYRGGRSCWLSSSCRVCALGRTG